MADAEGLSIEETNKLRLSLGLKPLNVGSAAPKNAGEDNEALTSEQHEAQAVENLRKRREASDREAQTEAVATRIRQAREKAERHRKLKGATLGDDDGEDTLSWIKRTRKLGGTQPVKASRPVTDEQPEQYSTEHLEGLRVGHDASDFDGGGDVILTLKDGEVLDDDTQDELINVEITEKENLKSRLDNKKQKSVYTSYEDDEVDPDTGEKRLLAHYDDDVDAGPRKKSGFAISSSVASETNRNNESVSTPNSRTVFSLEALDQPMVTESDYAQPIKSRKHKNRKSTKRIRGSESANEVAPDSESMDTAPSNPPPSDVNFVDDDDLQESLARQRRLAARRRALMKPEQIAATLRETPENISSEAVGLVLDETTEFTRGLQDIKVPENKPPRSSATDGDSRSQASPAVPSPPAEMSDTRTGTETLHKQVISNMGIEEEATFDQGIGAAMAMLRQKGVFQENEAEASLRRSKEAWLAKDKKIRMGIELERRRVREELRNSPRFKSMSARDREAFAASENKRLDALEAKATQERFKDYKPSIDIKYTDDFGRNMTQKEAFKHMSHQFHGIDSGSGKTAKKLAQIEKEKANEQRPLFSGR